MPPPPPKANKRQEQYRVSLEKNAELIKSYKHPLNLLKCEDAGFTFVYFALHWNKNQLT